LGVEGMGRSYRSTAYLGFGRVYFNIAASDAPEPLSPLTECADYLVNETETTVGFAGMDKSGDVSGSIDRVTGNLEAISVSRNWTIRHSLHCEPKQVLDRAKSAHPRERPP
jgi:hypothetical protein